MSKSSLLKKPVIWIISASIFVVLIVILLIIFLLPKGKPPEAIVKVYPPTGATICADITFDATSSRPGISLDKVQDIRYRWDFGDGVIAYGEKISHQYKKSGEYEVKLTMEVIDKRNRFRSVTARYPINIGLPPLPDPIAVISYSPDKVWSNDEVKFDASQSYLKDEVSPCLDLEWEYEWDFGDGTPIVKGKTPGHSYNPPKREGYIATLKLIVTDQFGRVKRATAKESIIVNNRPPKIVVKIEQPGQPPGKIVAGRPVILDASESYDPDGGTLEFEWDFDNDRIPDASGPRVKYTGRGEQPITLRAWDNYMKTYQEQPVVESIPVPIPVPVCIWPFCPPEGAPTTPTPSPRPGPLVVSGGMVSFRELRLWNMAIGLALESPDLSILVGYGSNINEVTIDWTKDFPEVKKAGYRIESHVRKATLFNVTLYYGIRSPIYLGGGLGFLTLEGFQRASCRVTIGKSEPPVPFVKDVVILGLGVGYKLEFGLISFQLLYAF
jgi:hypothetical protein